MKFPKTPPWIKELFPALIEGLDCQPRQMFGCPCAFVNGQMFGGAFGEDIFVRLPAPQQRELLALGGAPFDPMGGRPTREYVTVPREMLEDEEALKIWLERGLAYARALPPKDKKKARARPGAPKAPARARRSPAR